MSAIGNIKKMFVLMLENRSYDNVFGWSDLHGTTPAGVPTQADGLLGKPTFYNTDSLGCSYAIGQGAPFSLSFDPGHEFTDTLVQLCGPDSGKPYIGAVATDGANLPGGVYPSVATTADAFGFARDLAAHGYDAASALRAFTPDQLPVLNFLAAQFAVCDRWFSSMPGPTWPNRFFALAGTSWGLDHSPSDIATLEASFFDAGKFGLGNDSILTRLAPARWLVAHGDTPQAGALKGVEAFRNRFVGHDALWDSLAHGTLDADFVFVEPAYDPLGNFHGGESMHPCGDVRRAEALVERLYNALRSSKYWNESMLLIFFDEHGGFFDHVVPDPAMVADMPKLAPVQATPLTKRGFRFDRYGFRVPAVVVSPYIRRGTIDHAFHDHLAMAKTLATIVGPSETPLLDTERFRLASDLSPLFTLPAPRTDDEIGACPHALPCAPSPAIALAQSKLGNTALSFNTIGWRDAVLDQTPTTA
jgi:phospholipase C